MILTPLLVLNSPEYRFLPNAPLFYEVRLREDGHIPLLGGIDGKAEADTDLQLIADPPTAMGSKVAVKVVGFSVSLNGAKLPVDLDDAQKYYPGRTYVISPLGAVNGAAQTSIPNPFQMPGLDVKAIPQSLFVPIEFPTVPVVVGQTWAFNRGLNGAEAEVSVTWLSTSGDIATFGIKMREHTHTLQGPAEEVVTHQDDAVSKVDSDLEASGTVEFDQSAGQVRLYKIKEATTSRVTSLIGKPPVTHKLLTTLTVRRSLVGPAKKDQS